MRVTGNKASGLYKWSWLELAVGYSNGLHPIARLKWPFFLKKKLSCVSVAVQSM